MPTMCVGANGKWRAGLSHCTSTVPRLDEDLIDRWHWAQWFLSFTGCSDIRRYSLEVEPPATAIKAALGALLPISALARPANTRREWRGQRRCNQQQACLP